MKRILKILAVVVVVLVVGLVGLFASAFAGNSAIAPGTLGGFAHVVKDGFVAATVIDVGGGQVALIDAGNDKFGQAILAELTAMKLDASAVQAIFLTHGHGDHTAAVRLFPKAKVYALAGDVALAEGREGGHGLLTRWAPPKPNGVHVAKALADGESVQVGSRTFKAYAVPGHTAGSAAYAVDGLVFLGDSAGAGSDGLLHPAPYVFSDDPAQNRASLRTLATALKAAQPPVQQLVFAHTGPLAGLQPLLDFAAKSD